MKKTYRLLSWLFLLSSFGVLCAFMMLRIDTMLDSDMASELILAKVMNEEGRHILTTSWYYPSELRVLNFQIIMAPLFSLFQDWHMVRVTGSVVCYLLLLLSYYYFCCQLGMREFFPVTAGFILMPFCVEYFAVVLYGLFYITHLIVAFLIIGMLLKWRKCKKRTTEFRLVLGTGVLSLAGGLGGQRLLVTLSAPLVCAVLLMMAVQFLRGGRKNLRKIIKEEKRTLIFSIYSAVSTLVGLVINQIILAKQFQFRSYQFVHLSKPSLKQIVRVMAGWLKSLGLWTKHSVNVSDWPTSGQINPINVPLEVLICVVICCLILATGVFYLHFDTTPFESRFITAFLCSGGILMTGVYMITNMEFAVRYLLPVTVFVIPVLALFFREIPISERQRKILLMGTIGLVVLGCISTYYNCWNVDLTREYRQMAQILEKEGYCEGYASFWNGNVLTELSNGKIDMWVWSWEGNEKSVENIESTFIWLQRASHSTEKPKGSCFVLFSNQERKKSSIAERFPKEKIFYESSEYVMYGFDNYKELQSILDS